MTNYECGRCWVNYTLIELELKNGAYICPACGSGNFEIFEDEEE